MSPDSDSLAGQGDDAGVRITSIRYRGDHPRLRAHLRGALRLSPSGIDLYARHQEEPALSLAADEISDIVVTGTGWFSRITVRAADDEATFAIRFRSAPWVRTKLAAIDVLDAKAESSSDEVEGDRHSQPGERISRVRMHGGPAGQPTLTGELWIYESGIDFYARDQSKPTFSLALGEITRIGVEGGWWPRIDIASEHGDLTFAIRLHSGTKVLAKLLSFDSLGRKVGASKEPIDDATGTLATGTEADVQRPALEPAHKVKFTTFRRAGRGLRSEPDELASVTSWPFFVTATVDRVEGGWAYLHTSTGADGWVKTAYLRAVPQEVSDGQLSEREPGDPEAADDDDEGSADREPSASVEFAVSETERSGALPDAAGGAPEPLGASSGAAPDVEDVQLGWLNTAEVPVSTATPSGYRTCPTCSGEWPADSIFCGDCGSRFDASETGASGNWFDVERELSTRPDIPGVRARHLTPDAGLQAMVAPDPNAALAPFLAGRVAVLVTSTRGSWAEVELEGESQSTGWVDGRKLIPPINDPTAAPRTPANSPRSTGTPARTSPDFVRNWIAGLASGGIILGVLLDWLNFPGTNAFHIPFPSLFDYKSTSADPKLAYFLLACGIVGLILSLVEHTGVGRFLCGGVALLLSILYVAWLGHDLSGSVQVTDLMGPGAWVAGISGLILMVSPAINWST